MLWGDVQGNAVVPHLLDAFSIGCLNSVILEDLMTWWPILWPEVTTGNRFGAAMNCGPGCKKEEQRWRQRRESTCDPNSLKFTRCLKVLSSRAMSYHESLTSMSTGFRHKVTKRHITFFFWKSPKKVPHLVILIRPLKFFPARKKPWVCHDAFLEDWEGHTPISPLQSAQVEYIFDSNLEWQESGATAKKSGISW